MLNAINVTKRIDAAILACDNHTQGVARDPSLSLDIDEQVRVFRNALHGMRDRVASSCCDCVREGLTYSIAGGWPFESTLGKLISEAEQAYEKYATQGAAKI